MSDKILFYLILSTFFALSCKETRYRPKALKELIPRPSSKVLWSSCSEVPVREDSENIIYQISGVDYVIGEFLGEGGTGKVYALNAVSPGGKNLVLKKMKAGYLDDAYMDLLFHSTMQIIGVPTTKVGFGYVHHKDQKEFILVKERIIGMNFDDVVFLASLKSMNIFSPISQRKAKKALALAGQAYSRVINSGVYISDMHSRNVMWDESKELFMMVDGNVEPNETADTINIKDSFGRSISFLGGIGNRIFYERYYNPSEKSSDLAKHIARSRIALFYKSIQKECQAPQNETEDPPFEIDIHKVFGG